MASFMSFNAKGPTAKVGDRTVVVALLLTIEQPL